MTSDKGSSRNEIGTFMKEGWNGAFRTLLPPDEK